MIIPQNENAYSEVLLTGYLYPKGVNNEPSLVRWVLYQKTAEFQVKSTFYWKPIIRLRLFQDFSLFHSAIVPFQPNWDTQPVETFDDFDIWLPYSF
jgi:hypothetical protein